MIKGIEHLGLVAKNVDALCDWYIKYFDFKCIRTLPNGTKFIMANDGNIIEVYPCKSIDSAEHDNYVTGLRHIAFDVDDFDYEYDRIRKLGFEIAAEPVINENLKLVLFKDPEGNLCHLTQRTMPLK